MTTRPSSTPPTRWRPAATPRARARFACCARSRPTRVRDLERLGVRFDADRHGNLALGLEGGHSRRRIVHAGGAATGRRITRELSALAAVHERIEVLEPGAAARAAARRGPLRRADRAPARRRGAGGGWPAAVVLATGGTAALWERTTNPRGAVGAGLRLALAAGAELADLEFMQFHPTALRLDGPRDGFLITEAVRGEGATLLERGRRALRGRAGAARPGGAGHRGRAGAERRASRGPRRARGRPRSASPTSPRRSRRWGSTRRATCCPSRRPRTTRWAAWPTDLDGRSSLPGLYAVGESRLHRPARRQPAGLELARRVLRVRPPRRARRRAADPAPPTRRPRRRGGGARAAAAGRRARRCGVTPGLRRDAGGAAASCSTTLPAGAAGRGRLPRARRRAAARTSAPTTPRPTRRSTACIPLVDARRASRASSDGLRSRREPDELFPEAMPRWPRASP